MINKHCAISCNNYQHIKLQSTSQVQILCWFIHFGINDLEKGMKLLLPTPNYEVNRRVDLAF